MGSKPVPDDVLQHTVNVYHSCNYVGREAERQLKIAHSTFINRLRIAEERKIKPRIRVSSGVQADKAPEIVTKVLWFTDAHNQPGLNTDRFKWLAALVNDTKPDYLIDGGDFDDLNSLCHYERNDSWSGKFKPTFMADLEASQIARELLDTEIKHDCQKHFILGNHEDRLYQFENLNPEMYGMMQHAYEQIHQNWAITPYRGYLDIEGVDFTHIPQNTLNKPLGGNRCAVNVASKSIRDCCFGHTHTYAYWEETKLGPNRSTIAICGGSFMPDKYVPKYARGSAKSYWYGCHIISISGGRIVGHTPITMRELMARYS